MQKVPYRYCACPAGELWGLLGHQTPTRLNQGLFPNETKISEGLYPRPSRMVRVRPIFNLLNSTVTELRARPGEVNTLFNKSLTSPLFAVTKVPFHFS